MGPQLHAHPLHLARGGDRLTQPLMTPTRTPVPDLPRGHELAPATFTVTPRQVRAYLDAVGDAGSYGDAVPPLAAVAFALQALQERITLPDGSLHTGQEVEHHGILVAGAPLTLTGRVAQRSERQGMVISVLEYEISAPDGGSVRARTTVMAPAS